MQRFPERDASSSTNSAKIGSLLRNFAVPTLLLIVPSAIHYSADLFEIYPYYPEFIIELLQLTLLTLWVVYNPGSLPLRALAALLVLEITYPFLIFKYGFSSGSILISGTMIGILTLYHFIGRRFFNRQAAKMDVKRRQFSIADILGFTFVISLLLGFIQFHWEDFSHECVRLDFKDFLTIPIISTIALAGAWSVYSNAKLWLRLWVPFIMVWLLPMLVLPLSEITGEMRILLWACWAIVALILFGYKKLMEHFLADTHNHDSNRGYSGSHNVAELEAPADA